MWTLLLACYSPIEATDPGVLPSLDDGEDTEVSEDTDVVPPDDTDTSDPGLPDEDPPPNLVLNEVMTKNGFSYKVDGEYPDWVELYNDSAVPVAVDRLSLTDGGGRVWLGTEGEIAPGAYYIVYADEGEGPDHAPFTLDADGDTLTLAVDGWVVDRLATGQLEADVAWARIPDGGDWEPTIWITAGATNGFAASDTLNTDGTVFELGVHDVVIDLSDAAVSSLRSSSTTYVEGVVTVDGVELDPVGARIRGSSTLRTIDQKCSFKIDTNRYEEDLRFRGLKKFHLINMVWDAAHVREYVSYYLFREFGVPAARNSYAWVEMNGSPKGLYLFSEVYDDDFLKSWYGNDDGYLWEPGSGDFSSGGYGWDCEEGFPCDTSVIAPIASLLSSSATDSNVESLEEVLDLDNVLRLIAMEIAVGQWDGYCSPHNYRVYYDPETGLVSMQPSSLDLTFDNLGYNYGHNYFSCGGVVLSWCLSNDTCEDRYLDILDELADRLEGDDPNDSFKTTELLDEVEALIDPYAVDDATTGLSGYTYDQHVSQFDAIRQYLLDEPARIREAVDTRR